MFAQRRALPSTDLQVARITRGPGHLPAAASKGVVCGVRVEEVEDPLMKEIRLWTSWGMDSPGSLPEPAPKKRPPRSR